ncbi:MAG: asparagine synthase (glutamine-hydrolyzing) [Lutibacter sp.]|nr:MAG: asparagine synthase (glutamine-hydrolyzing) [Lutibacter sp.]
MCGIAGIINKNKNIPISNALSLMTNSMINRGPDDEGYLLFDTKPTHVIGNDSIVKDDKHINATFNYNYKLGFGFRHLKIVDLSNNSHQPMSDVSKRYWIVFNGEIYNYKEIKSELISLGHTFFSNSDTEVVLNAYKEWNSKSLDKFNGMFAYSILDTVENQVFIARDRIGIKPLYYFQNNEQFIFSSTQKAIIDSKIYSPKINWEGLHQNFRFSIAQRPNTCFNGISSLEPAHYLKFNLKNNSIEKKQYWEIPTNTQDLSLSENDALKMVEESLFESINYRLNADVEVGTFMSGGIDSTTIAVMASKEHKNIKCLTLGFKDFNKYNEVNQASDTANLHGLNHIVNYANSNEILKNIDAIITANEEPYHHLSSNYILSKMAAQNDLKVVLSGLGGDELFGGYDVYNKLKLWNNLKNKKQILQLLPNIHQKINKAKQLSKYKDIGQFYSHYYTTFNDNTINQLFKNDVIDTENTISKLYNPSDLNFTDDFEAISFYNLKSYIGNHQMRTIDQFTMHFSVEGRLPLLDHNFIETVYKIPTKFKQKGAVQKYILKQVAKKHIAPSTLNMSKKGLRLPLEYWISNELKEFVFDSISKLKNRNIFNNQVIDTIVKTNNEQKIWQLVSTELWIEKFIN